MFHTAMFKKLRLVLGISIILNMLLLYIVFICGYIGGLKEHTYTHLILNAL